jgi:hypothetical protein
MIQESERNHASKGMTKSKDMARTSVNKAKSERTKSNWNARISDSKSTSKQDAVIPTNVRSTAGMSAKMETVKERLEHFTKKYIPNLFVSMEIVTRFYFVHKLKNDS